MCVSLSLSLKVRVDAYDDMVAALEGNAKRGAPRADGAADDADDIDGLGDSDAGSFFLVPWKVPPSSARAPRVRRVRPPRARAVSAARTTRTHERGLCDARVFFLRAFFIAG